MLVGLTGGIGAGKSTFARRLGELGAAVLDADTFARRLTAPKEPTFTELRELFGPQIVRSDGALDRKKLAVLIFRDRATRSQVEKLLHPLVRRELDAAAARLRARCPAGVIVEEVPLLVEAGMVDRYDLVVLVDAPVEQQIERLMATRGLSEEQAWERIRSQASREQRLTAADIIVCNDGPVEKLVQAAERVWVEQLHRVIPQSS